MTKTKDKGYINIYRDKDTGVPYTDGDIWRYKGVGPTTRNAEDYVTTIRISWEEEV